MREQCGKCGKHPWTHTIFKHWEEPAEQRLCCKCYVEGGRPPADWHPLCMQTDKELQENDIHKTSVSTRQKKG